MDLVHVREHGSFYLYEEVRGERRDLRLMTDRVAILFDPESGTLHKHGDADAVAANHQRLLAADGELFRDWVLISSSDWDVAELNKMISCSGYVGIWHQRQIESASGAACLDDRRVA